MINDHQYQDLTDRQAWSYWWSVAWKSWSWSPQTIRTLTIELKISVFENIQIFESLYLGEFWVKHTLKQPSSRNSPAPSRMSWINQNLKTTLLWVGGIFAIWYLINENLIFDIWYRKDIQYFFHLGWHYRLHHHPSIGCLLQDIGYRL